MPPIKASERLVEVALSLDDINAAAVREQSIRHVRWVAGWLKSGWGEGGIDRNINLEMVATGQAAV